MSTIDTNISDCLDRMRRLAAAIEVSVNGNRGAELWMRLEHQQLGALLTQQASYNNRPDLNWSWMTPPAP